MFGWTRRTFGAEFPKDFRIQRIGVSAGKAVADLAPNDIATYFRENPEAAKEVLYESYDKRFTPSTFISEESDGFTVGWFSRKGHEGVRRFSKLHDAATDYVLFSFGKGRWMPPQI